MIDHASDMTAPVSGRAILVLMALGLPGCASLQALMGNQRPSAKLEDVRFTGLSLSGLEISFDARVDNPYDVDLPLVALDLVLSNGDTPLLQSRLDQGASIPAADSKRFTVPARLEFAGLLKTLQDLKPGGIIPYRADIGVSLDAPVLGRIRIPLQHRGEIGVPVPPKVSVKDVQLARIGLTEIRAEAVIEAESSNGFPIELSTFDAAFNVRNRALARSRITSPLALSPGGKASWTVPISINPIEAGQVFVTLFRADDLAYGLDGQLSFGTPFGRLSAPVAIDGRAPLR